MESANNNISNSVYKFSWVAYIRPIIVLLIILLIGFGFSQSNITILSIAGYIIIIAGIINFICNILFLKTFYFWIDDTGVWVFRGIFPWTKGKSGTTWRDVSDAIYFTGFISWSTKSYKIRVGHRFTKTSELIIPHLKNGDLAVIAINETVQSKFRD
ncbi:hypothetical protein [Proteus hauseri]|uniref:hypothetical protein n=1 Tax=Proteus hauseri TaxID=183417 RepID=UPI0010095101|nr:hypothetical protein [Proteus hauseri]QAV24581.1 hypothetical protein PH4a_15060 [Proteus hauseri]